MKDTHRNLLKGSGSLIDLFPTLDLSNPTQTYQPHERKPGDYWVRVGRYMKGAMRDAISQADEMGNDGREA